MSALRQAVERFLEYSEYDAHNEGLAVGCRERYDELIAALDAPDPLPEAVEIIERLLSHEKSWKQDQETRVKARDFVARHKGGGT